jgi:hypothetical protein
MNDDDTAREHPGPEPPPTLPPTLPAAGFHSPWERLPGSCRHPGPRHAAIFDREAGQCAYGGGEVVALAGLSPAEVELYRMADRPHGPGCSLLGVVHHLGDGTEVDPFGGGDDETRMSRVVLLCERHHNLGHAGKLGPEAGDLLRAFALDQALGWGER